MRWVTQAVGAWCRLAPGLMVACGADDDMAQVTIPEVDAGPEAAEAQEEVHWGYSGAEGPEFWGELSEHYEVCDDGRNQSPVDFPESLAPAALDDLGFDYAPTGAMVTNNGHTVVVGFDADDAGAGPNVVLVDGVAHTLLQFHFHAESEHRVATRAYPLEMHLVHLSDAQELAVVGVFLEEGPENAALSDLFAMIPTSTDEPIPLEPIDLTSLLPEDTHGWAYSGSLTTPPCTEGVRWSVFAQPLSISPSQLAAFTDLHSGNYRPVLDNADVQEQANGRR